MSMALVNAVTKLGKKVEKLESIPQGFNPAIYDELVVLIEELKHRINEAEYYLTSLNTRIEMLEIKRKPGRPRKDER